MAFKISQLVRFGRIGNDVSDFNDRNLVIIERLLRPGYRFKKSLKTFTKVYYRYASCVSIQLYMQRSDPIHVCMVT